MLEKKDDLVLRFVMWSYCTLLSSLILSYFPFYFFCEKCAGPQCWRKLMIWNILTSLKKIRKRDTISNISKKWENKVVSSINANNILNAFNSVFQKLLMDLLNLRDIISGFFAISGNYLIISSYQMNSLRLNLCHPCGYSFFQHTYWIIIILQNLQYLLFSINFQCIDIKKKLWNTWFFKLLVLTANSRFSPRVGPRQRNEFVHISSPVCISIT